MAHICCYCGSSKGDNFLFEKGAQELGKILAQENHVLVYGGAQRGLMGLLADSVLSYGGKVIGVLPEIFLKEEIELVHPRLTELKIVSSMHERKAMMASLADAFIALPGGIGTLEEVIEACVWMQIGIHKKPSGFLNIAKFYDPLFLFLDSMVTNKFLRQEQLDQFIVEEDVTKIIPSLFRSQPYLLKKWID